MPGRPNISDLSAIRGQRPGMYPRYRPGGPSARGRYFPLPGRSMPRILDLVGVVLCLCVAAAVTGHVRTRRRDRREGRTPAQRRAMRRGRVAHVDRLRNAGGL